MSTSVSGGIASAASCWSSAVKPPMPRTTTGPKAGVVVDAHDELDARGHHRLHDRAAHRSLERFAHGEVRGADGIAVGQPEPNTADVGLVHQPGCDGLQRDREADRVPRAAMASAAEVTVVLRHDGDAGVRRARRTSRRVAPSPRGARRRVLGRPGSRRQRGRPRSASPCRPAVWRHSPSQAAWARAWAADSGYANVGTAAAPGDREHRGWVLEAEQARHHRDVRRRGRGAARRRPRSRGRGSRRARRRSRGARRSRPSRGASRPPARRRQRRRRRSRSTGFWTPPDGAERAQGSLQLGGELGDLEPGGDAGIGRNDAGAAAVAHHRDPSTGRDRLVREQRRHVEQLRERVDADDPGLAEERVDRGVGIGQRGGVGTGAACTGGAAAALERDDRLAARELPGDASELARVAERLEVEQHDVGRRDRRSSTA